MDRVDELAAAWRPRERLLPGTAVPLRYYTAGRWRRVYGRPNRFSPPSPNFIVKAGRGHVVCDFRVLDPRFFDDVEQQVSLGIVPATTGGLMAPLVAPLSTVRSSAPRAGLLHNRGSAETPCTVRFLGPVSYPLVKSALGWEIGLSATLAYDEEVVVDPIAGTVLRNGVPAPGILSRSSRIQMAALQPGLNEITFTGTDPTGTAAAVLSWRNAYTSL
ncbi:phage distal tail protein [Arthrobacter woluwensis]|uniref:phage distal tail protein n=1 Tax=Arthrobacter woluwensis TaxID=156980 RepID=UPI0015E6CA75|nr:hypothetical protein [Arthrobacter woluwensis]